MVGEQAPGARLVLSSVPQTPEVPRASRLSLAGAVRCPAPRTGLRSHTRRFGRVYLM